MPGEQRLDGESQSGRFSFPALLMRSLQRLLGSAHPLDSGTDDALKGVSSALGREDIVHALRLIDRAWRSFPDHSELLANLYGRLLCLEARDHDAALGLLRRVRTRTADIAALEVAALLHTQRFAEAGDLLQAALGEFCTLPGGLLGHMASMALQRNHHGAAGWIGRDASLEFHGELITQEPTTALQIKLSTGAEFMQPIKTSVESGRQLFRFKLAKLPPDARLTVLSHGVPLLGTDCRTLPDIALDGRATCTGRKIMGWTRFGWLDQPPAALSFGDEHGRRYEMAMRLVPRADLRWNFAIDLRKTGLVGSRIVIAARLPDGGWQALPDTPLLLEDAVRLPGTPSPLGRWNSPTPLERRDRRTLRGRRMRRAGIDIIIPVYRGRRETLDCIDAALATAGDARVVVVDDATDDPVLAAALDEFEVDGRITLLRNPQNLGFVGSVNRALARSRTRDAVLLNSDAVVFGDWLTRLQQAAYAGSRVGTVTPFGNSGSIASYPHLGGDSMSLEDAAALHRLAGSKHDGVTADIPVGVGFCLYIRRDCLNEVGELDAAVFGKGYGEETDFCLRASARGWSHRLAADVFVYHSGGRSFGSRRDALLSRSQRLLNLRHPGFNRFVADFVDKNPLHVYRRGLDEARLAGTQARFVLLVSPGLTGGVARFVDERCRALRAEGLFPLVLRPIPAGARRRCELWTDAIDVPNLQYDSPADLAALEVLLRGLTVHAIEIQHFLHLDPRVIDLVRALGVPYDVVVHDYVWICPRITLLDGEGRYCREPPVAVCESCVRQHGSKLDEEISVSALRRRSHSWLSNARGVAAPSADTASRLRRYFDLPVKIRPHTTVTAAAPLAQTPKASDAPLRIAMLGGIGHHKGYALLLDCARDARARQLPLEFVVIGYTEKDAPLQKTGKVFITGRYAEGEASHLLKRERPDIIFMPSVWPETWCYTLDEALSLGLPIVAFDLGAIGERLRAAGLGHFLPLDIKAAEINDTLLELRTQTCKAPSHDGVKMSGAKEMTKSMNKPATGLSTQQEGMTASVQMLPLSAGLYLFSVKTAAVTAGSTKGGLQLPAMLVSRGPGVSSDQVEFTSGPSTDEAWLFAKDDCLVIKVTGAGASLVLMSVRNSGGETLAIAVERLDARNGAAVPSKVAATPTAPPPTPVSHQLTPSAAKSQMPVPSRTTRDSMEPLSVQVGAHIRSRGDMVFKDADWAGRIAPGLWIESFSVKPLQRFEAGDVEYKGLTGSGFETPWLSDGAMCGTKGMAVPLVGFAIRLKPSRDTVAFDCEYSGFFKSGATVGPLRNGTPCRSTVANDPLEGIQLRILKRTQAMLPAGAAKNSSKSKIKPPLPAKAGPSFGRYRDNGNGHAPAAVARSNGTNPAVVSKPLVKPGRKATLTESQSKRAAARRS